MADARRSQPTDRRVRQAASTARESSSSIPALALERHSGSTGERSISVAAMSLSLRPGTVSREEFPCTLGWSRNSPTFRTVKARSSAALTGCPTNDREPLTTRQRHAHQDSIRRGL
jgi:hypothetical protein